MKPLKCNSKTYEDWYANHKQIKSSINSNITGDGHWMALKDVTDITNP